MTTFHMATSELPSDSLEGLSWSPLPGEPKLRCILPTQQALGTRWQPCSLVDWQSLTPPPSPLFLNHHQQQGRFWFTRRQEDVRANHLHCPGPSSLQGHSPSCYRGEGGHGLCSVRWGCCSPSDSLEGPGTAVSMTIPSVLHCCPAGGTHTLRSRGWQEERTAILPHSTDPPHMALHKSLLWVLHCWLSA